MNVDVQDSPDAVNAAPDQSAEPPPEAQLGDAQALLAAIRKITRIDDLEFDAEGDISLRRGSQMVYVVCRKTRTWFASGHRCCIVWRNRPLWRPASTDSIWAQSQCAFAFVGE